MKLFRVLFVFDTLAVLISAYFLIGGLQYDTSGSGLVVLLVLVGMLGLAWVLQSKGKTTGANVLLAIMAVPFLVYGLFVGLFIVLSPDMR